MPANNTNDKRDLAARQIRSVTYLGMVVNVILSVLKIIIGLTVSSLAMLADGVHSFSDLATDIVVLVGARLGAREPDRTHPYGHGRIETFSAILIAIILMLVGGAMVYRATIAVARNESTAPHWAILAGALLSILGKEWLYRMNKRVAVKIHSAAVYANAWHHRSDAFSSVAVLIGYLSMLAGFDHGDQLAAIAVGLMVIFVGVRVIADSLVELTEGAVDPETVDHIKSVISANPAIHDWHRLRTRTVGREVFLDVHILVNAELNIAAAHEISEGLERTLDEEINRPVNITVHIEPDLPSFRR
jgi:cation diffusion facilitator family transporter